MLLYEPSKRAPLRLSMREMMEAAAVQTASLPSRKYQHQHIFIVTGPAGCGKTTVAKSLARHTQMTYIEGDDHHPPASLEKMSNNIPLTDADRWDWLVSLREVAVHSLSSGQDGVIVTCSALKKKYRDVIRIARYNDHDVLVHFIYLRAPADVLMERVNARQGHFMKKSMVESQLQSLEEPMKELDAVSVDVSANPEVVDRMVCDVVKQILKEDRAGAARIA